MMHKTSCMYPLMYRPNEQSKLFLDYKSYYSLVRSIEKSIKWDTKISIISDTVSYVLQIQYLKRHSLLRHF